MRSWDYQVSNLVILVVWFVISKKHEVLNFFLCVYINNIQCNLKPKITQSHSPHVQRCSLQTPLIQWFIIEKTSDIDITNKVQEQLKGLSQSRINMSGKLNVGLSNFLRISILNILKFIIIREDLWSQHTQKVNR